jgi:hypothetical protein
VACAALLALAGGARAESSLRLPYPDDFQTLPASTYSSGEWVGNANVVIEQRDEGVVRMFIENGFEGGARTVLSAELGAIDGGHALRPVWQESRSFDPNGRPLGILRIDHQRRVASCTPGPDADPQAAVEVPLPDGDRVANVPLNLLFLPLVRDERSEVDFQFFLCGGGPRMLDFEAHVAERRNGGPGGRHLVEIRYGPDFGPFSSMLRGTVVPRLSVWFDPQARTPWLAHRLPLYSDGPEVLVVRDGVPRDWLKATP